MHHFRLFIRGQWPTAAVEDEQSILVHLGWLRSKLSIENLSVVRKSRKHADKLCITIDQHMV